MRTAFTAPSFAWHLDPIISTGDVEACVSQHTNSVVRGTLPNVGLCRGGGSAAQP